MASVETTKVVTCADMDEYDRLKIHIDETNDGYWTVEYDDAGWKATLTGTEEWTP